MQSHLTASVPLRRTIPCWYVLKSLIKCKADERKMLYSSFRPLYLCTFAFVRVARTSKAMQTTAIRTVANSLPENGVILLTFLISKRYIPYTDLHKFSLHPNLGSALYGKYFPWKSTVCFSAIPLWKTDPGLPENRTCPAACGCVAGRWRPRGCILRWPVLPRRVVFPAA